MTLNKRIVLLLKRKKLKIAFAESCTGGMLSSAITSVSGSSKVFTMGLVTYANQAKVGLLKINPTMNNKTYGTKDLASLMGYGDMKQNNTQASAEQTFRDMGKEVDPNIAKAMTRNYGDLMKAIDKKKGKK